MEANTVAMLSLWRNDADRHLAERIGHLLSKTGVDQWWWVVGDSTDHTEALLRSVAMHTSTVTVFRHDTGIRGEDVLTRRRRTAATASHLFSRLTSDITHVVLHESDLRSDVDVVPQLHRNGTESPIAGWPTLGSDGELFYDIWAYRGLDGHHFQNHRPYHPSYRADDVFAVESFGSVWAAPAHLVRNRVLGDDAVVDLCAQWRREGALLWVDPRIRVVQPVDLWSAS